MSHADRETPFKEMSFFDHLEELRHRVTRAGAAVLVSASLMIAITVRPVEIGGITLYYPWVSYPDNLVNLILKQMQASLLPDFVDVIVTAPAQAIIALIIVSLFMGLIISMPIIIYESFKFVSPGLYPHEKRLLNRLVIPSTALFVSGAAFSYFVMLPFTYRFLYFLAVGFGAITFITIEDFISFTILFMAGMGLAFQLPLIMVALSYLDIVEPKFWKNNFRWAFLILAFFGAIITPDGSGITMWFVTLPMFGLYWAGYMAASKYHGRSKAYTGGGGLAAS